MQIHQFVHTLNYGDAISGEAIAIQRLLQESGFESRIYSVHAHEKVSHLAVNWRQYEQDLANSAESDSNHRQDLRRENSLCNQTAAA